MMSEFIPDFDRFVNPPSMFRRSDEPGFLGSPVDFWSVEPSSDAKADFARGEALAQELIAFALTETGFRAISYTLADILRKGRLGPLECGFFNRIGRAAFAGSLS